MHPCVVTYPVGRGAARLPHTATPCWTRLACQQRLPLSNQAAQFTVRAYAPDRNASVSTKQAAAGVSHELRDILAPTCTIAHVKRQSPSYKPELSQIVHRLPSFKSKVSNTISVNRGFRVSTERTSSKECAILVFERRAGHMHRRKCFRGDWTHAEMSSKQSCD